MPLSALSHTELAEIIALCQGPGTEQQKKILSGPMAHSEVEGEAGDHEAPHFMHSKALQSPLPSIITLLTLLALATSSQNPTGQPWGAWLCAHKWRHWLLGYLGNSLVMLYSGYSNSNNNNTRISGGIRTRMSQSLAYFKCNISCDLWIQGRNAVCLVPRKLPWK